MSENFPTNHRKSENFFGRRHGKALRPQQKNLLDKLLPELILDIGAPPPKNLQEIFSKACQNIRLEIGFGGGEHLAYALDHKKDSAFIGVEPFVNGMAKFISHLSIQKEHQSRTRLFFDDATFLLDWLPAHSIDAIDLFYPDPWPKKKHWKRRFVNQKNLDRFARILKPGGLFRFASDIDSYVNWTVFQCQKHPSFHWLASSPLDWQNAYHDWPPQPATRYEAKAFKEGRKTAYLTFRYET